MVKRLLSELKALSKLEPTTGVVLAEGVYDRNLIRQFVRSQQSDWAVYDCNAVEDDLNLGQKHNCRSMLIQFSKNCECSGILNIVCVVDADLEMMLPVSRADKQLLLTDYANMAMYGLTEDFFNSIDIATGVFLKNDERRSVLDLTTVIFLLRVAKESAEPKHSLPALEKALIINGGMIKLDVEEYERLIKISSRDHPIWRSGINSAIEQLTPPGDPRKSMNDHDFCIVVSRLLKGKLNRNVLSQEEVLRALMISASRELDRDLPMFTKLKVHLKGGATTPAAHPPPAPAPAA